MKLQVYDNEDDNDAQDQQRYMRDRIFPVSASCGLASTTYVPSFLPTNVREENRWSPPQAAQNSDRTHQDTATTAASPPQHSRNREAHTPPPASASTHTVALHVYRGLSATI